MSEFVLYLAVSRTRAAYSRGDDLIEAARHAAEAFDVPAKAVLDLASTAIEGTKTARRIADREPPIPPGEESADVCKIGGDEERRPWRCRHLQIEQGEPA